MGHLSIGIVDANLPRLTASKPFSDAMVVRSSARGPAIDDNLSKVGLGCRREARVESPEYVASGGRQRAATTWLQKRSEPAGAERPAPTAPRDSTGCPQGVRLVNAVIDRSAAMLAAEPANRPDIVAPNIQPTQGALHGPIRPPSQHMTHFLVPVIGGIGEAAIPATLPNWPPLQRPCDSKRGAL